MSTICVYIADQLAINVNMDLPLTADKWQEICAMVGSAGKFDWGHIEISYVGKGRWEVCSRGIFVGTFFVGT